ncbi:MAG: class I SAM-dependent methyltransferase [Myxococcota bacterium]
MSQPSGEDSGRSPSKGPRRGFFDLWSGFYDLGFVQRMTYRPVHDAVCRALREEAPAALLDIGCGTGLLTERLCRELPDSRIVGCDFSLGMLGQARRREVPVRWVRGNAMELPFADGSFAAATSTDSFHWFPDQGEAAAELFRVLEPRGRLLLAVATPPLEVLSEVTRLGSRVLGEPLVWPTRSRLDAMLRRVGFEVVGTQRVLRLPAPVSFPTYLTIARRPR